MTPIHHNDDIEVDYTAGGLKDFAFELEAGRAITVEFDGDGPLLMQESCNGPDEREIIALKFEDIPRMIDALRAIQIAHGSQKHL